MFDLSCMTSVGLGLSRFFIDVGIFVVAIMLNNYDGDLGDGCGEDDENDEHDDDGDDGLIL